MNSQKVVTTVKAGGQIKGHSPLQQRGARGLSACTGGFSLIELVLTMLILGIIAAAVSQFALQGIRSYSTGQDRGDAHSQARLAMERVVREARGIRSCADISGPIISPSPTLSFTDITGTLITFNVNIAGNLTRKEGIAGVENILAQGVTLASAQPFRFLDMNGADSTACPIPPNPSGVTDIWFVEIDLTCARGNESLHLRSRVHPRNFQ